MRCSPLLIWKGSMDGARMLESVSNMAFTFARHLFLIVMRRLRAILIWYHKLPRYLCPPSSLVSPKRVVGRRGGSRYFEGDSKIYHNVSRPQRFKKLIFRKSAGPSLEGRQGCGDRVQCLFFQISSHCYSAISLCFCL